MKNIIITLLSAVMLSSCSLWRSFEVPENEVNDIAGEPIELSQDTFQLKWQVMFTDAKLQALITKALQNNADLRTAKLTIDQAEASLLSSKLSYVPSFALSPEGGLSYVNGGQTTWTYNIPVQAQWEIDVWGRMRNQMRQAKISLNQSQEFVKLVETQVVSSVANLYYTLVFLRQQLSITERTSEIQKKNYESIMAMKEAGMQTESAVNQAQASYYSVLTSIKDIENQIVGVNNNISLILGEIPQEFETTSFEAMPGLGIDMNMQIPIVSLSNRPDVKMAEYTLAHNFYGVNIANAAFYPQLSIGGSIGWTNNIGTIVNPAKFLLGAIASLTQPLFNKGRNIANLRIAKVEYQKSLIGFEQTLLAAGNEVNGILAIYNASVAKVDLRNKQVASGKKAYENNITLMQNSSLTYLEVLVSESMYLNAQLAQAADWLEQQQQGINLYRALGGGSETLSQDNVKDLSKEFKKEYKEERKAERKAKKQAYKVDIKKSTK